MDRAHELLTLGEMKEISSIPFHEMVSRHVHKLVQVILPTFVPPHFFFFFFFFFVELLVFFGAEMTSKFNKEMYKKIKEKKNEPLSSIG